MNTREQFVDYADALIADGCTNWRWVVPKTKLFESTTGVTMTISEQKIVCGSKRVALDLAVTILHAPFVARHEALFKATKLRLKIQRMMA